MSALALDLGTKMGWAMLRADERVESGNVDLSPGRHDGPGARFMKLHHWLTAMKREHADLDFIAYENVMFIGMTESAEDKKAKVHTTQPLILYGGALAVVQMFAELHRIKTEGYNVATIKKQFVGSGKAQKVDVIKQCHALGFRPQSDNEADAIAVLHVATNRCPLLTMSGATSKGKAKSIGELPAKPF